MKPFFFSVLVLVSIFAGLSSNAQSTILWHRSYDSGTSDEGKHVSVNSQGSVYVAGLNTFGSTQTVLSLKYDSTGTLVFAYKCVPELPGNLVKIERAINANIYALSSVALSGGDNAYSISKYTASASFKFQYNSGDSVNYRFTPVDIAVDAAENVIVAGTYEEYVNQTASGFFIKQISSTGTDKWTRTYKGTGITQLTDLVIDNSSNVYVCGVQSLGASSGDFIFQKYNANGLLQWTKTFNGTAGLLDRCEKIAVDNATGNVYVTGTTNYNGVATQSDNVLVKYNSSGVRQWQKVYGHTGKNSALEVLFDATGNAYVVGNALNVSNSSGSQPNRIFTTKFSAGGTQQWIRIHNNGNFVREYAKSAVSDVNGNIYVGAEIKDSASFVSDMLAFKLSNSGVHRWEQRGDGLAGENDFVSAIIKDNLNNVYVTGRNGNASYDVRTTRIADKIVNCGSGFTQVCYLNKTRCVANADLASFTAKGAKLGACIGLRKFEEELTLQNDSYVYPNPSSSSFTLRMAENEIAEISLLDFTGRELIHSNAVTDRFNFGSDLSKGVYLLKIFSPSGAKILKLIKTN